MDYQRAVKILFDTFYGKIYKNGELNLSPINLKYIDNFKIELSKRYPIDSLDVNFLIHYFSFAFNYWYSKEIVKRDRIAFHWIVGKGMVKRFFERNTDGDYYIGLEILKDYSINLDSLRDILFENKIEFNGLDPNEENSKASFSGDAKFYNCINTTTLFDKRSIHCICCEFKNDCISLLMKNYPQLYKKRGLDAAA